MRRILFALVMMLAIAPPAQAQYDFPCSTFGIGSYFGNKDQLQAAGWEHAVPLQFIDTGLKQATTCHLDVAKIAFWNSPQTFQAVKQTNGFIIFWYGHPSVFVAIRESTTDHYSLGDFLPPGAYKLEELRGASQNGFDVKIPIVTRGAPLDQVVPKHASN